ncbi:MAG: HAMP domain-containing protein [Pseudomonadota bacterium]
MVSQAGESVVGRRKVAREPWAVSLRTEVLLSLGVLIIFALALNAALVIKLWEDDLVARRLEAMNAMATTAQALAPNARATGGQTFRHMLPLMATDWAALAVYDNTGAELARSGSDLPPCDQRQILGALGAKGPVMAFTGRPRFFLSHWGQGLQVCKTLEAAGVTVGVVRVVSPARGLGFGLGKVWGLVVLFTLLNGLLAALVGSYLLGRRIVAPVERMAGAAAAYSPGKTIPDLSDLRGSDEIGRLARSLETMMDGLEAGERKRVDHVERLEQVVHQLQAQGEAGGFEKLQ